MGSTLFRNPRALSSALTTLGSLQPRAIGFLNRVDPSDLAPNYYTNDMIKAAYIQDLLNHRLTLDY